MADKASFARFTQFGASLRQSAQELSAKAAAQVKEGLKTTSVGDESADAAEDHAAVVAAPAPAAQVATATTPTSLATLKAESVSKEELLDILQKMNRKVKVLALQKQQLTEQKESAEASQARLRSFVVEEILNGVVQLETEQDELAQLQAAWRQMDEDRALNLQQLQSEFQAIRRQQMEQYPQQQQEQKPNGDAHGDEGVTAASVSAWEHERAALLEQHQRDLKTLRETLMEQHATELRNAQQPSPVQVSSEGMVPAEEVQKVRDAAAAQLDALKKKFVVAHQQGQAKLRSELEQKAQEELRTKTAELQQALERQREELEQRLEARLTAAKAQWQAEERIQRDEVDASSAETEIAENRAHHEVEIQRLREEAAARLAAEIEKTRQEVEQTVTTDMEERLQELLGDLRRQHQSEIEQHAERASRELAAKLAQQAQAIQEARDRSNQLQVRIDDLVREKADALQALRVELESAAVSRLSEIAKANESELAQLRFSLKEESNQAHEQLENTTRNYDTALKSLRAEIDHMSQALVSKDAEISQLQEKLDRSRSDLSLEADEKVKTLQEQLEAALHDRSVALETQRSELVTAYEKQISDVTVIKDSELLKMKELFKSQAANAQKAWTNQSAHEKADLAQQIQEWKEKHEALITSHRQELETIREQSAAAGASHLSELQQRHHAELEELQLLRSQNANKEGSDVAVLREQLGALQTQLANAESDFQMSSDRIQALERQAADLRAQLEVAMSENTALKAAAEDGESSSQQSFEDALTKQKQSYEQVLDNLQKELENVASLQDKASTQLETSQKEIAQYKSQVASLEEEKRALSEQLKYAEQNANGIAATVESMKAQHEQDQSKMLSLEEQIAKLVSSNEKTCASHEETESQIRSIRDACAEEIRKVQSECENALASARAEKESELNQLKAQMTAQLDELSKTHVGEKEELRQAMEAHVDKMKAHFIGKLDASKENSSAEIALLRDACQDKDQKLAKLVDRLKSITASTSGLKSENEGLKLKVESQAKLQLSLRTELESLKKSMEETVANSSAAATSLLQQQETLEAEKAGLEKQVVDLKGSRDALSNQVEELTGKLQALSANLNAMAEDQKTLEEKLSHAAKTELKLSACESEVSSLREQVNKLKLDLTQISSLAARLQAEKDANERSQGERSALVGMLESQLSEQNEKNAEISARLEASLYDLEQKDEALQVGEDRMRKLESELSDAKTANRRATEALAAAQKGAEAKTAKTLESLQKEVATLKQQMARKSAAAQKLLQEREAECGELRRANKQLQQEVDKGSLSDRRIFELAAKQSNRESHQVTEIEIRDKTIESMKTALLERDGELAIAESQVREVESQVEELCRVRRREDVNLDYLKSIVVKYLSLPPGSSERARLLPVLATLLQFNAEDYQTIEEGKKKVSWWGSVAPTLINAPPDGTPSNNTGSAEVAISRDAAASAPARSTALQF